MVLKRGVGVADGDQDEEEKERPQQLHQEMDLGEWRGEAGEMGGGSGSRTMPDS